MASKTRITTLALSLGDPAGIGPEITAKALKLFFSRPQRSFVHVFAPLSAFTRPEMRELRRLESAQKIALHAITWGRPSIIQPGNPTVQSGRLALAALEAATSWCQRGKATALITGPLDKFIVSQSGLRFEGHTEYLQRKTGARNVTMILHGKTMTVALCTTHIPLKDVARRLTKKRILQTINDLQTFLKFEKAHPRLAILGLNPHASDRGLFGSEEARIIQPATRVAAATGVDIEGPFSPDSFFSTEAYRFDGIVALYHDQGLIPLKMLDFSDAINVTMGLPFLRTSVDHGPAFSIARKGKADAESLLNALLQSHQWAKQSYAG